MVCIASRLNTNHPDNPMPNLKRTYQDGRDEMNLADFPISILQRQQPSDEAGRKLEETMQGKAGAMMSSMPGLF